MKVLVSTIRISCAAAVAAAILFLAIGCKPKGDPIVGSWKDPGGNTLVFSPDHTYVLGQGEGSATGKWSFYDNKVTYTIEKIGGQAPDAALRASATRQVNSNMFKNSPEVVEQEISELAQKMKKPVYVLSADGKTMSSDGEEPTIHNTLTRLDSQ